MLKEVINSLDTVSSLDHLPESERYQLLIEWNDTDTPYSSDLCIHQLFEVQVEKTPGAIAVVYEHQQLSYQELNRRANQLAHYLIEKDVKPDTLVGICVERSLEMVIGILGILKAGCAYVPLDPDYPQARLSFMLEDANLRTVISQSQLKEKTNISEAKALYLNDKHIQQQLNKKLSTNLNPKELGLTSDHLAYVIYTSGSTGNPKGVMVEHSALVNRIEWMCNQYGCDSSDVILQKTPFSFDVSVWEFFLPLISGARIVLARAGGHKDPIYLSKLIQNKVVTKLHFVPSMLNAMLSSTKFAECVSVKQVFCSGEALQPNSVDRFYKQGINAELHNLYGPTEAAIDVSYWACSKVDTARSGIPIGRPIDNIQLYIVDQQLQPTPQGVAGELLIGGVGLARGYLNRPELTAEKFIPNPFSDEPQKRLYKTGDLCRHLPDGNIEFLGRIDNQVKIRGFRIELGEIENILVKHNTVTDVVVLNKSLPTGSTSLVAYVVCNVEPVISKLREHLAQNLPEYMIPSDFVVLPELPVTANGKVDRKALLAQEIINANNTIQSHSEMSFLQNEVYKIWKHILGYDDIDLDEDLFKVGGDSIVAIQIFTAVNEEFGVNIYMEELFSSEHFSIRWIAELIEKYQINLLGEQEYSDLLTQIEGMSEEEIANLLLEQ
jgi:amino acid adenylation domain-containing protein